MAEQVRLLLVEDDRSIQRATARVIRSKGFAVTAACSCAEARLQAGHFDIGVFDIELGDGSGVELAQAMRFSGQIDRAVFYSGGTCQQVLRRAVHLGPVISKSEGAEVLVGVVRAALRGELRLPIRPRVSQGAISGCCVPADWADWA